MRYLIVLAITFILTNVSYAQFGKLKEGVKNTANMIKTPTPIKNLENDISKSIDRLDDWKSKTKVNENVFRATDKKIILYEDKVNKYQIQYPQFVFTSIRKQLKQFKHDYEEYKSSYGSVNAVSNESSMNVQAAIKNNPANKEVPDDIQGFYDKIDAHKADLESLVSGSYEPERVTRSLEGFEKKQLPKFDNYFNTLDERYANSNFDMSKTEKAYNDFKQYFNDFKRRVDSGEIDVVENKNKKQEIRLLKNALQIYHGKWGYRAEHIQTNTLNTMVRDLIEPYNWEEMPDRLASLKGGDQDAKLAYGYLEKLKHAISQESDFENYLWGMIDYAYEQKANGGYPSSETTSHAMRIMNNIKIVSEFGVRLCGDLSKFSKLKSSADKFLNEVSSSLSKQHVSSLHTKYAGQIIFTKKKINAKNIKESDIAQTFKIGEPVYMTYFALSELRKFEDKSVAVKKQGGHLVSLTIYQPKDLVSNQTYVQIPLIPSTMDKELSESKGYTGSFYKGMKSAEIDAWERLITYFEGQSPRIHEFEVSFIPSGANEVKAQFKLDASDLSEASYREIKQKLLKLKEKYK